MLVRCSVSSFILLVGLCLLIQACENAIKIVVFICMLDREIALLNGICCFSFLYFCSAFRYDRREMCC